jgi:hypothetical protein
MNSGRSKGYQRKRPVRPIPPGSEAASDLYRWIHVLRRLRARGVSRSVWRSLLRWPGDDPLGELIVCLKKVLAGRDAAEVFRQRLGSGRRKSHQNTHTAIASAYWRARGPARQQGKVNRYAFNPTEACGKVRRQRKEWANYSDDSIRRWAHKYRGWPVAEEEFTSLDP